MVLCRVGSLCSHNVGETYQSLPCRACLLATTCVSTADCLLCRTHEEAGEQLLAGFPDSLLKLKGLTSLAISSLGVEW